jgi:hypothetical protein
VIRATHQLFLVLAETKASLAPRAIRVSRQLSLDRVATMARLGHVESLGLKAIRAIPLPCLAPKVIRGMLAHKAVKGQRETRAIRPPCLAQRVIKGTSALRATKATAGSAANKGLKVNLVLLGRVAKLVKKGIKATLPWCPAQRAIGGMLAHKVIKA